jgi:lipoprotein-anchoring transpeptidase ErfK/SrfK
VDLSDLVARAMQGNQVMHEARIVAGRESRQTPRGTFRIQWRAETRTMDSSTIGIPLDSDGGYRIPLVRYAQYFTNRGTAIHGNYWVNPDLFGEGYTSRGCVGMSNEDARVFWDFASVGTRVVIQD